jgi:hemin uptake protein HemP
MQLRVNRNSKGDERRMTQSPRPARSTETQHDAPVTGGPDQGLPMVESTELMGGQRELMIRHGRETYRLRVTASNKLILTK